MTERLECDRLPAIDLTDMRPYFSVTILECQVEDLDMAYQSLVEHFEAAARKRGRALAVEILGATRWGESPDDETSTGAAFLVDRGFDRLYALLRRRDTTPSWASEGTLLIDSTHELTLALRRGRLIAIRSDIEDTTQLLRWADRPTTPFKPLLPEILQGTFNGDGRMAWLQGVHRQRVSKPDSKALGGSRLQEAYDPGEDYSYALTAMRVDYAPEDANSALRGVLTVSPDRSHLSSKAMQTFSDFVISTDEALTMLEKAVADEEPPDPVMPGFAVREKDAGRISGAFDVRVSSPEEIDASSGDDSITHEAADLLRSAVIDVTGQSGSPDAIVAVGEGGSLSGRLLIRPTQTRGGFDLEVRLRGQPTNEPYVRRVRDAIQDSDLLSIYYESGHTYASGQVSKQSVNAPIFANMIFRDFRGIDILREKPRSVEAEHLHERIAVEGDNSIFSWVVAYFNHGLLVCDDGAGEIADFLHLSNDGTLTAVHVKAAHSKSTGRRIAVTCFEELVSQAEKNIKRLENDELQLDLGRSRMTKPACWVDGERVTSRDEFVEQLAYRSRVDKTYVMLVQPHIRQDTYEQARAAAEAGGPTVSSRSLALLDNLLHSTRRTVTNRWDDLFVVGAL